MQINFYFVVKLYFFMISKQKIKFISSLKHTKYRLKFNCFIAEGEHVVRSFMESNFKVNSLFATKEWIEKNKSSDSCCVTKRELGRISCLKNPSDVLAIIQKPNSKFEKTKENTQFPIVLLDGIADPGNMGSIIRTADWFGLNSIYLSEQCVDVFNPKVVQATMGSLARLNVFYVDSSQFLYSLKEKKITCYGACLSGKNIYTLDREAKSAIVFGNESHGISLETQKVLDDKILIPRKNKLIDSLNVAVSFGIILSEFR